MIYSEPTQNHNNTFLPPPGLSGEVDVSKLRSRILQFAMKTFDLMDSDGNGFVLVADLETALKEQDLLVREIDCINFMLRSVEKIGHSFPDSDRTGNGGISRVEVAMFFEKVFSQPGA
jgi:hypothetical protein